MKLDVSNRLNQRGVSLIELLVVIVIIGVVSSIALFNRGNANEQFQRQNIARELKVAFERARFDSVKRRADSSGVQATVNVAANSFTLRVDTDQNGVLDAADDRVTDFAAQNISISASGTIYFNRRGEPVDSAGTVLTNVLFLVCNGTCPGTGTGTTATTNVVLVTPTGTVNLLPGGSTPPSFTAPSLMSVPTDSGIDPDVKIP